MVVIKEFDMKLITTVLLIALSLSINAWALNDD